MSQPDHESLRSIATAALLLCVSPALDGCRAAPGPGDPAPRHGDEISVCGQLFHTGTRIVLWYDPLGYDAYRPHRHFDPAEAGPSAAPDRIGRYGSFRDALSESLAARVRQRGWDVDDLRSIVSQVVIHYDQCGTSRRCFEVLHDIRGLSCHFLLDVDGTVYQTLDLKERAWHAAHANDRSIGIELAGIGCYPTPDHASLEAWYAPDGAGRRLVIPEPLRGHVAADFVGRPARSQLFSGEIHGTRYHQYDFTEEQYRALEKLLTTLCRIFPAIEPRVPENVHGTVLTGTLPETEMLEFAGFIGHFHLSEGKRDPGPAFDWMRVVAAVRNHLDEVAAGATSSRADGELRKGSRPSPSRR